MAKKQEIVVAEEDVAVDKYKAEPEDDVVEMLAGELDAMITQRVKTAREYSIMVEWEAAKMIKDVEAQQKVSLRKLIRKLSITEQMKDLHLGERKMWEAVQLYKHFPVFEKVYETEFGENVTLNKLHKLIHPPVLRTEPTVKDIAVSLYNRLGVEMTKKLIEELQKLVGLPF